MARHSIQDLLRLACTGGRVAENMLAELQSDASRSFNVPLTVEQTDLISLATEKEAGSRITESTRLLENKPKKKERTVSTATAKAEIPSIPKEFTCNECGTSHDSAREAIDCCVSRKINPWQVGDVVVPDKGMYGTPAGTDEAKAWLTGTFKVPSYNTSYQYNAKNYPQAYYVVTAITESTSTVWQGSEQKTKVAIRYHLVSKAFTADIYNKGWLEIEDMSKSRLVEDPPAEILEKIDSMIGTKVTVKL